MYGPFYSYLYPEINGSISFSSYFIFEQLWFCFRLIVNTINIETMKCTRTWCNSMRTNRQTNNGWNECVCMFLLLIESFDRLIDWSFWKWKKSDFEIIYAKRIMRLTSTYQIMRFCSNWMNDVIVRFDAMYWKMNGLYLVWRMYFMLPQVHVQCTLWCLSQFDKNELMNESSCIEIQVYFDIHTGSCSSTKTPCVNVFVRILFRKRSNY